jgi:hypothetical protein
MAEPNRTQDTVIRSGSNRTNPSYSLIRFDSVDSVDSVDPVDPVERVDVTEFRAFKASKTREFCFIWILRQLLREFESQSVLIFLSRMSSTSSLLFLANAPLILSTVVLFLALASGIYTIFPHKSSSSILLNQRRLMPHALACMPSARTFLLHSV